MRHEITLPKFAHAMTEGEIGKWYVTEGERIRAGEPLFDLITEKVTVPIESPVSGTVEDIQVPEKEIVPVGTVVATIKGEA
jgi:pyruvate/2-oxoglutarate dehydrogenase complex dihydrolipoamide acyltransferase (E2) component